MDILSPFFAWREVVLLLPLLLLLLGGLILGVTFGRFRLVNFLITLYISTALVAVFPQGVLEGRETSLFLFLGAVILLTLFDASLFDLHFRTHTLSWWRSGILGMLEAGLFFSLFLHFASPKMITFLSSFLSLSLFVSPWAPFVWMVLPLAFLLVAFRR